MEKVLNNVINVEKKEDLFISKIKKILIRSTSSKEM